MQFIILGIESPLLSNKEVFHKFKLPLKLLYQSVSKFIGKIFIFMVNLLQAAKNIIPFCLFAQSIGGFRTTSSLSKRQLWKDGYNIIKQCIFVHVGFENIIMRCFN